MAYASWSVVFGEQPSAAKWNILGTNDASFNDGTGLNTGAVQQIVYNMTGAVNTGSTAVPIDDTIPQIGEGDQYMSQAITPKSTSNILVIEVIALLTSGTADKWIAGSIFQDANSNALATQLFRCVTTASIGQPLVLKHVMLAGTTSSTTFKFRAGGNTTTLTFNGTAAARLFGGVSASSMTITEYKA